MTHEIVKGFSPHSHTRAQRAWRSDDVAWTWRHAAALRAVRPCRGPECSDGHGVVEGHVALLLEVREVGLGLGWQLDALDERERAQSGPQVDVVVREAALGRALGAVDERLELEELGV